MGELAQSLGKLIMVDGKDEKHWSGPLKPRIVEEAADVVAAVVFLAEHNFSDKEFAAFLDRRDVKINKFK